MKKVFVLIILALLSLSSLFVGCQNSQFELVSSVEFVSNGKRETMHSVAYLLDGGEKNSKEESSQYEYEMVDKKYRFPSYYMYIREENLGKYKKIPSYHGLTADDYGRYIYWGEMSIIGKDDKFLYYYKKRFYGWDYRYIYVKVINNKTISIYDSDTDEANATTYTVTSYKITHFN